MLLTIRPTQAVYRHNLKKSYEMMAIPCVISLDWEEWRRLWYDYGLIVIYGFFFSLCMHHHEQENAV